MKDIITDAYKENSGERPTDDALIRWSGGLVDFTLGWNACQEFMLEEQAKEKDDREEQNDLEHLYTGDF